MRESVLNFACEGQPLVGILAEPDGAVAEVGVIIIVGGPQYRAGSHRQFTLLARHLASNGHAALRFDYRSMGDSPGDTRDFMDVEADIAAAIAALLAARPTLKRVVLWGLCDAASAALMYLAAKPDARVAGLVMANPWVRSTATLAATHVKHYYGKRLMQKDFWRKLLSGGIGTTALKGIARNLSLAVRRNEASPPDSFQSRMAVSLNRPQVPVLIMLSTEDLTAREFSDMFPTEKLTSPLVACQPIVNADHTFSNSTHHRQVLEETISYLHRLTTP